MRPVWMALRADLRARWRAMTAIAVLLGVIGGVVLTAAAGAQRTATAYPRLLQWASAAQVDLVPNSSRIPAAYFRALRQLPQVASVSAAGLYQAVLPGARAAEAPDPVRVLSSPDGTLGISADRVKILAGRPFASRQPGQAMVDEKLAAAEHLRPGGTLHLLVVPDDPKTGSPEPRQAVRLSFRVSAVVVFDDQIVPGPGTSAEPTALLSSPFTATGLARRSLYGTMAGVRVRPGARMAGVLSAAAALAARYPGTGGKVDVVSLADQVAASQRAIRPQAAALALFAALAGLIALAVIGQLLSRQLTLDSADFPVLGTLGMTRPALAALSLARTSLITGAGGLIAVGVAVAASPLMPIGAARLAEPAPGIAINLAILGAGLAVVTLAPLALLVPSAWRTSRAPGQAGAAGPAAPGRASRLGALLDRTGPVTGGIGVRMALEPGRGRAAVPVRSALVGMTVAIAAVLATAVFSASMIGLVSTPHRYGQNWAQVLDLGFGGVTSRLGAKVMSHEPALAGVAAGDYGELTLGTGRAIVPAIGLDPLRGRDYLTLLAGRPPAGPGEIVLGTQTIRALHRRLGQSVLVTVDRVVNRSSYGYSTRMMRIVGVAVFPAFSRGSFTATDLGTGAAVPARVLSEQSPQTRCMGRTTCYNFFLLRYRPGADVRADGARLQAAVVASGCPVGSCLVSTDQRPAGIRNYGSVRDTPLALGAVLALLAVATLIHVLVTSVRRRRRDLATLQALGLRPAQVLGTVLWQAATLAAVALAAGLPTGVIAGRWAWRLFATAAGVAPGADVPLLLVLGAIPVTLALALAIAAGPGSAAARVSPAAVLRAE